MRRHLLLACLPFVCSSAIAAERPDLPPAAQVLQALRDHPAVRAAQAEVRIGEANRARLAAGPYEFAVRLATQRRDEQPTSARYREHEIAIERTLRLPGKAAQDAALGAAGVAKANSVLGDAMHETARLLLKGWFDWQRADANRRDWAAQTDLLLAQRVAVSKKVGAGEAAKLEAMLAEAQLAQAEAQLAQAEAQRNQAALAFERQFPGVALPNNMTPLAPEPLTGDLALWRERMLGHSHELKLAAHATQVARLDLRRLDAERVPDPTIGLQLGRERSGQERIVGMQLTIPLPGEVRSAAVRVGAAEADAAAAREMQVRTKVETEAQRAVSQAQASYAQWQRLAAVASRMEENVRLLEKAWRLGEGQFGELQAARRQAIETRLAATQSQLDASEAYYRLLLDADVLWNLEEEEND